ncbi:hypothetical protein ACFSOZ_10325 [Mesorhizobium newzealandense]|uniref:Uncharacterized protein n=1 Tax=Mesorhizobium newzealandense TaxID=1300302 RepID=A0ABW4U969_9HYPH
MPYTKVSLVDDFADLRTLVFGAGEKRRLMDMRRSGAVEANAGGSAIATENRPLVAGLRDFSLS